MKLLKILNDSFNNEFLVFLSLCLFALINNANANNIQFKAKEILTYENGDIIIGHKNAEVKIGDQIEIFADKYTYYKKQNLIIIKGNVEVFDSLNKIKLDSELIHYKIIEEEIISLGKTTAYIDDKYLINSSDIHYTHPSKIIYSHKLSTLDDNFNNKLKSSKFKYFLDEELYKGIDINLFDNEKNKYFLSDGIVKLNEQLLIGKDIKILLRNNTFGNPEHEPKLKGNSVSYKNNLTVVKKGIFTSCKSNDNCPPWSITSKEIIHDKLNKVVRYKNAWLKIYDRPVLYFPKFFHPDPTVERKSGFLIPTFGSSKKLGASIITPYFHVIGDDADLTLKPRIFSDEKYLIQSEFRKVTKNSSHIVDMSLNHDQKDNKNGSKTHFFSNSKINLETSNFDESKILVKIERTSNDNYIDLYSLEDTESIVNETTVLESSFEYTASKDNLTLDFSVESYEIQNQANSDRFEFVYPNYSVSNLFNSNYDLINNYNFSSSGNQKKFSTNIYEAVQINDLITTSNDFINNFGLLNKFEVLVKNVNSVGKNSSKFKDNEQAEFLSVIKYDLDLPLFKKASNYQNYLTPKLSLRHSPNASKNNRDQKRYLNIDNIFSSNRIGFNDSVEGGTSLTVGLNFDKKDIKNNKFFSSSIATVYRNKSNSNLPTNSTLGKKQSDFVGNLNFIPNEKIDFNYNYSINNDLDELNLHEFENRLYINNFVNNFTFYEENNLIGNKSFFENEITYNFNNNNSFSFKTRENKKTNLTEFYNLLYQYQTDCLIASVKYNKEYYSSSSIDPSEELFFTITLIPLGSTNTDNVMDIGK
ncbi:hypothetical protein N9T21_03705 [Candidatus Pelagibacter sp.]|nr:hypothetical protein [Candidatus Pelagibacter sp.]